MTTAAIQGEEDVESQTPESLPHRSTTTSSSKPLLSQHHEIGEQDQPSDSMTTNASTDTSAVYTVWPLLSDCDSYTARKEPSDRIMKVIMEFTDKPKSINKQGSGDRLLWCKAFLTESQASILEQHPDVGDTVPPR